MRKQSFVFQDNLGGSMSGTGSFVVFETKHKIVEIWDVTEAIDCDQARIWTQWDRGASENGTEHWNIEEKKKIAK